MRYLFPLLVVCLFNQANACQIPGYTGIYDKYFAGSVYRYWPLGYRDWCWLKVQAIAESSLVPTAVSPAGAKGLLQIMPGTWNDIKKQTRKDGNIFSARMNVLFSAFYMRKMLDFWIVKRSRRCRLELAQASYNAGAGNILKAQGLANGERCWGKISAKLDAVTGRHAVETINYVKRIAQLERKRR